MRICSNFKDYYDVIQAHGQDQETVYRRYPKVVVPGVRFSNYRSHRPKKNELVFKESPTVGFCGRTFLAVKVGIHGTPKEDRYIYSVEDMDKYVREFWPKSFDKYRGVNLPRESWTYHMYRRDFEQMFRGQGRLAHSDHARIFTEYHTPVWIGRVAYKMDEKWGYEREDRYEVTIDACLKDVEFFRVFDPFQAFQEIYMFISNLAAPPEVIPTISDEDMAAAKGFDKYSFRKDKKK